MSKGWSVKKLLEIQPSTVKYQERFEIQNKYISITKAFLAISKYKRVRRFPQLLFKTPKVKQSSALPLPFPSQSQIFQTWGHLDHSN